MNSTGCSMQIQHGVSLLQQNRKTTTKRGKEVKRSEGERGREGDLEVQPVLVSELARGDAGVDVSVARLQLEEEVGGDGLEHAQGDLSSQVVASLREKRERVRES